MAALYERGGTVVNTYGMQKTLVPAVDFQGVAKDGADIAAEISLVLSKTKGFALKDVAGGVKKAKAGKIGAGGFKPVAAKAVKPA